MLSLIVDAEGAPRDVRVERALGDGLDINAIETVNQWKFQPGMKDDQPVAVAITVEMNFRLY